MSLFADVFDGLDEGINGLFGTDLPTDISDDTAGLLGKGVIGIGGALLSGSSSDANSDYNSKLANKVGSEQRIASRLQNGVLPGYNSTETQVPIHSRNEFKAVESVDPMTLENEWHNRLLQYANITRETGVSQSGK